MEVVLATPHIYFLESEKEGGADIPLAASSDQGFNLQQLLEETNAFFL